MCHYLMCVNMEFPLLRAPGPRLLVADIFLIYGIFTMLVNHDFDHRDFITVLIPEFFFPISCFEENDLDL